MCYQCVDAYDMENKIVWKKNAYALVTYNDPDVIFNDIVFCYDEDKNEKEYDAECNKLAKLLDDLSFYNSYCLCKNMSLANYDQEFNGFAEFYLYDLISAKLLELKENK